LIWDYASDMIIVMYTVQYYNYKYVIVYTGYIVVMQVLYIWEFDGLGVVTLARTSKVVGSIPSLTDFYLCMVPVGKYVNRLS
jgi:hypothetical protein